MTQFLEQLEAADKNITLAINALGTPCTNWIWQTFSDKYIWIILYVAVVIFLFKNLGWKRALISIVAIVLTITACDQFGNFCKEFFARYRPCWSVDVVDRGLRMLEGKGNLYGFYSAHAANAMGFALGSLLAFRGNHKSKCTLYGILVILWALLVGISRVFVGKHFFGDVIVGFAVGAIVSSVLLLISNKICEALKI